MVIITTYLVCLGVEKKNTVSLYDLYGHALEQEPLTQVMIFIILVDPSLVIITTYLVCLINAWEWKRFLNKYSNLKLLTPKLRPLWGGVMKKWGSTTIESGPQYIYILQSFVFSRENYMISSVFSALSCYITCIAHTFHINGI